MMELINKMFSFLGYEKKSTYMAVTNKQIIFVSGKAVDVFDFNGERLPISEVAIWRKEIDREKIVNSILYDFDLTNTNPLHWYKMGD